jgi:MarR family transcriptional regulator, transcriptional regulator for hemolysin
MSTATRTRPPKPAVASGRGLAWLLSQAGHALITQQQAALEGMGITPRGYCVMSQADTGQFSQTEIARDIGLDKTTMVVTIDALEADGLVERLPSPTDRRARVIALTKAGRKRTADAADVVARIEQDVLAGLSAEQRKAFVDALDVLVDGPLATPAACSTPVRRRT